VTEPAGVLTPSGGEPPDGVVPAEEELEQAASPFTALYEHWERHQWSALAIDLRTDAASFRALDRVDQDGLVWMFANRFHAEFNVARLLAPFLLAAPDYGMQLLLATQVADEHRHLQVVLRIYEEVFGVQGGLDAVRELADRNLDPVSKTLLYDKLEEWVLPLNERRDEDTFLQAVLVYHVLGEGVIARTGQNLAAAQYRSLSGFPGLSEGQRLVSRDEARHIGIGVSYVRRRMDADPERTRALIGAVMEDLFEVAGRLLETANAGMTDLVVSGYGVDPEGFYAEVMRLVAIRLRSIGFVDG
jgi:ribonucleotide reductase beta subunit family protein with ferritin-like domain